MSTDKKVDFLVCGTQKGGTTALRAYLQKHNSIDMPKNELHFFDNDSLFGEKRIDYAQYHKSFSNNDGMSVWGETTPIYMYWKECPKRIFDYNPQMKLIFLLGGPVKRA